MELMESNPQVRVVTNGDTQNGRTKPEKWMDGVVTRKSKEWCDLDPAQRREELKSLSKSGSETLFEEVVSYLIQRYPSLHFDHLEYGWSYLVDLSTPRAIELLESKRIKPLTLRDVPQLMAQGIPSQKLKRLLAISQQLPVDEEQTESPSNGLESSMRGQVNDDRGTIAEDSGAQVQQPLCVGTESEYFRYHLIPFTTAESLTDTVKKMVEKHCCGGCKYLDNCLQGVLSCSGAHVNLNDCKINGDTMLHTAACYGLVESAREILNQGYTNMLLENRGEKPNTQPLVCAVESKQWATVKVILDTLNFSQRQVQIRVLLKKIQYKDIVQTVSMYKKPWWPLSVFHCRDLDDKLQNDGKVELLKAILDTTVKGHEVDPSLLLNEIETEKPYDGHHEAYDQTSEANYQTREANDQTREANDQTCEANYQTREANDQTREANDQTREANDQTCEANYQTREANDQTREANDQTREANDQTHEANDQTGNDQTDCPSQHGSNDSCHLGIEAVSTSTKTKKSFFRLISETNVEELKNHPSFTTLVQHKWSNYRYSYIHGCLSFCYVFYLILFTVALVLAAESSDPRVYAEGRDFLRLYFEIVSFLYLSGVFVIETVLFSDGVCRYLKSQKRFLDIFLEKANLYFAFEVLRYSTTLLIIPLRFANDHNQWWMASIAIILSGLRLFTYATVLPFMGKFVGVLILIAKHDLPRLFGVFVVLNFSFGSGLYFALVGHHNDGHVDVYNGNTTSEVYRLWLTGVQMVIEGSVLTYIDNDGFNLTGRIIYWIFVFSVTIAFAAVLIAQFHISFQTLSERAKLQAILKKCNIMRKMDRFVDVFHCGTVIFSNNKSPHEWIKRSTLNGPDDDDTKDYAIAELSRKVADNNEQVKKLTSKLEEVLSQLQQQTVLTANNHRLIHQQTTIKT